MTSKKVWLIPIGVVAVALVAFVAFGVFGVHTLFIDDTVNEAAPTFGDDDVDDGVTPDPPDDSAVAADVDVDPEPVVATVADGTFTGRSHPAAGQALVLTDGNERVLRFEDFETDNGPDLFVYLSTAPADAPEGEFDDDFVDLGRLKGNIGDQNYEIPADVDLGEHATVVIWCKRFSVAFGAAELS